MKKYFYLFLFLIAFNAQAKVPAISGTITESNSGHSIENVDVSIVGTDKHVYSDSIGRFYLQGSFDEISEIAFYKTGYLTIKIKVNLNSSDPLMLAVQMEVSSTDLNEVDITSDKPVSAASSKFLSKIDFENRPKNSAQDMLRLVPGLFIAQHAGGGKAEQIFIRGFDCDHGTDVATFVDGIPVNMPSHGHGQGYEDLHFLIPETVEGMEIFKGPYSPKFGDFATGAAVRFNTLDSIENNLVQFETGVVPNSKAVTSNRGLAMIQLPRIASNVTSYFAADVLNNRGYFEDSQSFKRVTLFSKTTFNISERSHLHLSIGGFGSSWDASGQVPERAISQGLINRFGSIDNSEGGNTQRNNFNLVYHTQIELSDFEIQTYVSDYQFRLFSNFTFFLEDQVNGDEIEQDDNRTVKGVNMNYSVGHKLGNMDNKFSLGASFRSDNIENQLWHTVKRQRLEAKAHSFINQRSSSIFANEVFRFNSQFRVELGARFDYFIFNVQDVLPTNSSHENYSGINYQTSVSPKLNAAYSLSDQVQFFFNAGYGFHSNDARVVVQDAANHQLPVAFGSEIGTLTHLNKNTIVSSSLWWMDMENELVYVGDEGTTENKGPSRRMGIDLSVRLKINNWLFADADLNISNNYFIDKMYGEKLQTGYYLPLAPVITSSGGLTFKRKSGFESAFRYRYLAERPANEFNTIVARGYTVFDVTANYKIKRYKLGISIENLFNTEWNEAQFDTESRLKDETQSVDELHFTPGTPFAAKFILGIIF